MNEYIVAAALIALPCFSLTAEEIRWREPAAVAAEAVANHPTLRRASAELDAARERASSAGTLPNPMLMGGVRDLQVDLSRDEMMTMVMVGASQTLVRPSKRRILRGAAEADVDRASAAIESLRVEIEREALFLYHELAALDSQIAATEAVARLTDAIVDSARVRYETGGTIQADLIRAQLTRTNIAHELLQLRTRRTVGAARLAILLGVEPAAIPELTILHELPAGTVQPLPSFDESHAAIAALAASREREERAIDLARAAIRPDIDLEASYGARPDATDMISVVARIEIPFRRRDLLEPRVREAIARRDAAALQIEELRRTLARDAAIAAALRDEAEKQVRLHEEVLVPQSKLAFDSALAAYQAGKGSFESLLAATNSYLRLEIDYYGFLAQHLKSAADLDALRRGARFGAIVGAGAVGQPNAMPAAAGVESTITMSSM